MSPSTLIAIAALLAAAAWAATLFVRAADWRMQAFAALIVVVAVGQGVFILSGVSEWRPIWAVLPSDLATLVVAGGILFTAYLLGRIMARQRGVERAFGVERAYLTELFENSPEAIALTDASGRLLRVNPSFTALFGYERGEVVGRYLDDLVVPPNLVEEAQGAARRSLAGQRVAFETVRRRRDGTLVDVSVLASPVPGPEGEQAVFAIYHDISSRRRAEQELRRLQTAVESTQLGVTVTDADGLISYINPADAVMHGYAVDDVVGRDFGLFADDPSEFRPREIRARASVHHETMHRRRDGSLFPVEQTLDLVRDADGEVVSIVSTCEDISKRRQAERDLRESEERYALAARGANDGLWDWDVVTGTVYYSERWAAILGYPLDDLASTIDTWLERVHADDAQRVRTELDHHLAGDADHFESEHRLQHRDGSYRWVLVRGIAIRDRGGQVTRMAGSLTDTTPRKHIEEQLARDALYDPLTQLPNRALFTSLLERATRRAQRRRGYMFGVLFFDLDRFKLVNDSLGHAKGDELLVGVAKRLERSIRPGDVVARLAGDEFCVLLDGIKDAGDATRVAERVLAELNVPFMLGGHRIFASASIGIATSDREEAEIANLLRDADTAMYRAKSRGKARFEIFDVAMHRRAMAVLEMENDLRLGLEQNQFRLVYQPVYALAGGDVRGVEALIRWDHPKRGAVAPREFIPIAEETGVIIPLGWWVLRKACEAMAGWCANGPLGDRLFVSVNISAKQLQQPDFIERLRDVLHTTGIDAVRLKLELPETVLMQDPEHHFDMIGRLADLGVQMQIDDFGTGYSSLTYLNDFRIDTLKIDGSLIRTIGTQEEKSVVLQAIIALAHDLGIHVVAEGVENATQLDALRQFACEDAQGFYFSEPVDPEDVHRLFATAV